MIKKMFQIELEKLYFDFFQLENLLMENKLLIPLILTIHSKKSRNSNVCNVKLN